MSTLHRIFRTRFSSVFPHGLSRAQKMGDVPPADAGIGFWKARVHMTSRPLRIMLLCAATVLWGEATAQPTPVIRPASGPLPVTVKFAFDEKTRRAASGIACTKGAGTDRRCLVVFDEGTKAQFATLSASGLRAANVTLDLVTSGEELDAEAAANDGVYTYVVGSHSVKRKSCKPNPASRHVIRFKTTWTQDASGSPRAEVKELEVTDRLWGLLKARPELAHFVGGCLGDQQSTTAQAPGINIEGMAARGGRLYFGFRSPSINGSVPVYSVTADSLFGDGVPSPNIVKLEVGADLGIRDMATGATAILLLVGPDDREPATSSKWYVSEWRDQSTAAIRRLAELDLSGLKFSACFKELKPEALTILEEAPDKYKVVVLSDGVCDGGPLLFDLPR